MLAWGVPVNVKVAAFNQYGDSADSGVGTGNDIVTNPDAPTNLIEILSSRTPTNLGIQWQPAAEDGGTPVIAYRLSYD